MRRLQAAREYNATSSHSMQRSRQQQGARHEPDSSRPRIFAHRHQRSTGRHVDPITPCIQSQQQQQQQQSWVPGRRALLAAVSAAGLSWLPTPAKAQSVSTDSSIGSGAAEAAAAAAPPGADQQQPGLARGMQEGAEGAPAGAGAAAPDQDDLPAGQGLDDDDDSSSSSSSSSSSDSDSDSSSDEGEEEPGELFASSDDNNAAGGGGSSSDGSSGGSSGSSTGTADSRPADSASSNSGDGGSGGNPSSSSGGGGGANGSSSSSSSTGSSRASPASRTTMGSNLSVPSYIQILQDSRRSSWPLLAQKIQAGEWIAFSQLLQESPFDAVRQACFYIPWALLQSDDFDAAVAARKAYVDYIDHVHALAAIALKAADGVPGADLQVQQAFTLMNASLNAFLAAVPVKYQRYRI